MDNPNPSELFNPVSPLPAPPNLAPPPCTTPDLAPHPVSPQVIAPNQALVPDPTPNPAVPDSTPSPAPKKVVEKGLPNNLMYKNRLQEYTQKSSLQLPVYQTFNEGPGHMQRFRSTVWVDGAQYTSQKTFLHRKAAEQDAANLALESILKRVKDEECPLIDAEKVFCKSILNEFAVKVNREKPTYNSVQLPGTLPVFTSTLVFDGVSYTGDAGRNKKEAEQLAARTVILSLLGNSVPVGVKVGHCSETTVKQEQVVSTAVARDAVPASAIPPAASGMHRPHHDFKRPRLDPDPAPKPIPFPIAFEHPVSEQPLGVDYGSSSAKKRCKCLGAECFTQVQASALHTPPRKSMGQPGVLTAHLGPQSALSGGWGFLVRNDPKKKKC